MAATLSSVNNTQHLSAISPQAGLPPIRAIRQAQGLSLDDLSKLTGIDNGHLSRMERGIQGISLRALYKIAREIGPRELERLLRPYVRPE